MTSTTVIQIAGIPVLLRSSNQVFRESLADRYSEFIIPAAPPTPIELTVAIDSQGFPSAEDAAAGRLKNTQVVVTQTNDKWRFDRYDFLAEWSAETRNGTVRQAEPVMWSIDSVLRVLHSIVAVTGGGCLMHAASAIRNGRSFVFTGVSGAGKTTISGLIPPDAKLLTDEISYIRPDRDGYRAFGTPFMGHLGIPGNNVSAPLKAIYLLVQGPENKVRPVSQKQAAAALLRNVLFFAEDPELVRTIFETVCRLVVTVPVYELTFLPTTEVWEMIA